MPLNTAISLRPIFLGAFDVVRRRRGWGADQFMLDVAVLDGALRLSGYQGDPEGLPIGVYDLGVEVESYRFQNAGQRVVLREDGEAGVRIEEKPDRRRVQLADNMDRRIEELLNLSALDGVAAMEWLRDPAPRAARKACLLNILAKLRVPPAPTQGIAEPLLAQVERVFFADVDRIYCAAARDLAARLDELVKAGLWVLEGEPEAAIHRLLLKQLDVPPEDAERFRLRSYRQGGRNCVQIVLALPPDDLASRQLYADIDIDLGNPLWDLEGLLIHAGELLDPDKTDHLALAKKLRRGPAGEFLAYRVVS